MSVATSARPPTRATGAETVRLLLHEHRNARRDQIAALTFASSFPSGLDPAARMRMLTTARRTLEEIDAALQRVDDGSYGTCQSCGERIASQRLLVVPYARHCAPCAAAAGR